MMRFTAVLAAVIVTAGCASDPAPRGPVVVRSSPPQNYEATISNYFDLSGAPPQHRLAFGAPETSPCAWLGGAGMHTGWVVPVIYDTSPANAKAPADNGARSAHGKLAKANAGHAGMTKVSASGTGPVSMDEVSITGTRYFFWFSSDTLSAVTRRADQCP